MYSVIILCAGKGTRTGLHYNKMLYHLGDQTIYEKTLSIFENDQQCQQIIVVTTTQEKETFVKLTSSSKAEFAIGGKERQDSVYAGLKMVKNDYVLIHDGARPYVKQENIKNILDCLKTHDACLLMVPCKDTIKRVYNGKVIETLQRNELMQAQTPQGFRREVILGAIKKE